MEIETYTKAKEILEKYNQKHLLQFYNELDDSHKNILINQILTTNFEKILTLYKNSYKNEKFDKSRISPLKHFEKAFFSINEINYYIETGEKVVKDNHFAVVTMAGGQGTRLGYKGPKGTYELKFEPLSIRKSLFQIICEDLKMANKKFGCTIPWYIMTSEENDKKTKEYFDVHNYFDYPKNKVKFFTQDKLPIISTDGKLILKEQYEILSGSNGNGNVFKSMLNNGIIDELEANNIEWVSFGGIDNVLLKNVDTFFLGLAISKNYEIASKSMFKKNAMDKIAVYCKKDNHPSMYYYEDMDEETSNEKFEDGTYKYRDINLLSHYMNLNAIKKATKISLPYHRAYKKNTFVNHEGMKQVPDKPNSFKFENFIFDAFYYFDDMLLLRVDENDEFAPIKDFNSQYNPDTAIEKYKNYWKKHKEEYNCL